MIINTQLYSWSCTSTKQPRAKGKGELEKAKKSEYLHEWHANMSGTIENRLQRQAALPHFFPHFHRIFYWI